MEDAGTRQESTPDFGESEAFRWATSAWPTSPVIDTVVFSIGTAAGVLMGKVMYRVTGKAVNPLIGAAGVSAVPMAARVANRIGLQANPQNFLLMHAMGPNVAGVIGSAVAAGVLLSVIG